MNTFLFLEIIDVPLGWILFAINWLLENYGVSILIFALIAKLIMLPSSIKTHKNQVKMREIQPKIKKIQDKYHNDNRNPKMQQEMQDLYTREGYSPMAGCLPTLLQFPLIFGLWDVVRQPLTYILDIPDTLYSTTKLLLTGDRNNPAIHTLIDKIAGFQHDGSAAHQLQVEGFNLGEHSEALQSTLEMNEIYIADAVNYGGMTEEALATLGGRRPMIDTEFLGINLGETAGDHDLLSWFILIPIIAALSSFLVSFISMRVNKAQTESTKGMNAMMYLMPLLSLYIGYSMTIGVALYWISTNILSLIQAILLPKILDRKKETVPIVKEKKLNYTQIEKMKRDGEKIIVNGEVSDEEK